MRRQMVCQLHGNPATAHLIGYLYVDDDDEPILVVRMYGRDRRHLDELLAKEGRVWLSVPGRPSP